MKLYMLEWDDSWKAVSFSGLYIIYSNLFKPHTWKVAENELGRFKKCTTGIELDSFCQDWKGGVTGEPKDSVWEDWGTLGNIRGWSRLGRLASLKRTFCTWKWMVGIRLFPFGARPIFRCKLLVSGGVGVFSVWKMVWNWLTRKIGGKDRKLTNMLKTWIQRESSGSPGICFGSCCWITCSFTMVFLTILERVVWFLFLIILLKHIRSSTMKMADNWTPENPAKQFVGDLFFFSNM